MLETINSSCVGQFLAYLDPGTGSIIVQSIVAGALGAMIVMKMYWRRVVNFFKGTRSEEINAIESKRPTDD